MVVGKIDLGWLTTINKKFILYYFYILLFIGSFLLARRFDHILVSPLFSSIQLLVPVIRWSGNWRESNGFFEFSGCDRLPVYARVPSEHRRIRMLHIICDSFVIGIEFDANSLFV